MSTIRDRRDGDGRRRTDHQVTDLRAIVHDVGHEITTMSYLIGATLADDVLSDSLRSRLELVQRQTGRLVALIQRTITPAAHAERVAVRSLLEQLVSQANLGGGTMVVLTDGPAATAEIDSTALWRILANILGNAVNAAGPNGTVSVTVSEVAPVVIEIADDGPGFDAAEPGWPSLGLTTVRHLSQAIGAEVSIGGRDPVGTLARLVLPQSRDTGGQAP